MSRIFFSVKWALLDGSQLSKRLQCYFFLVDCEQKTDFVLFVSTPSGYFQLQNQKLETLTSQEIKLMMS